MLIDYDHNPALTEDQKLQSLKESMQMALNELTEEIIKLKKKVEDLESNR